MFTEKDVSNYLKTDPKAFEHPQIAQDFYNFIANQDWRVFASTTIEHIPVLWEQYLNDKLSDIASSNKMTTSERRAQYWDFIYNKLDGLELREFFSGERNFTTYSDNDQGE